jgi:uncharacterized membrane protein
MLQIHNDNMSFVVSCPPHNKYCRVSFCGLAICLGELGIFIAVMALKILLIVLLIFVFFPFFPLLFRKIDKNEWN